MKILQGTRLYSILTGTCPVCHKDHMYEHPNAYKFSKTLSVKERCDHCFFRFRLEPSFFYGAMYVSYALGVAIAVPTFIIYYLLFGLNKLNVLITITVVLLILMPIIQRLSRNIWLNLFIGYNPKKASNTREENLKESPTRMA
ncbi:MAG TPA: DUF983 domain-containing protein [Flavobacteriaceae bacterium]|nr:DUF983 domain-containing protein [Flavobacteriaceae bacterium]